MTRCHHSPLTIDHSAFTFIFDQIYCLLKEIIIAIQSYADAHDFIRKHRLWKWILIPGLIYTILFAVGIYFFWISSGNAVNWISENSGLIRWLQKERSEFISCVFVMANIILRLVLTLF